MGETDARRGEDTFVKKKKKWEDILNELRLPTKNGLQRQKRGRQERNIHLFSPVLQAYTWDNNIWEAPLPCVKQAEPTLNLKIEDGPSLTKYNGACELFWQRSIKVVMGWLSGRGTGELMTSSPQLKKASTLPPTPSSEHLILLTPSSQQRQPCLSWVRKMSRFKISRSKQL